MRTARTPFLHICIIEFALDTVRCCYFERGLDGYQQACGRAPINYHNGTTDASSLVCPVDLRLWMRETTINTQPTTFTRPLALGATFTSTVSFFFPPQPLFLLGALCLLSLN
ncbi:hypothetical protein K432DRAFT_162727 [Lepidopterella palustris CBS 459.81]|uniref:Secreted protein n=1 Tax=Lepidopterella palustris CBS 459.81 TaxID=1314670 RepID=A0A8E2JAW6_9PEZI|nr:hypothetical protein K432DRAFT_162727 [Lepidopterella palustris CBS 459.81]